MNNNTPPITPGQFVKEMILDKLNISVDTLAKAIQVPPNRIYLIIQGKRDISIDTALRLGKYMSTGPEVWLHIQMQHNLFQYESEWKKSQYTIQPYQV